MNAQRKYSGSMPDFPPKPAVEQPEETDEEEEEKSGGFSGVLAVQGFAIFLSALVICGQFVERTITSLFASDQEKIQSPQNPKKLFIIAGDISSLKELVGRNLYFYHSQTMSLDNSAYESRDQFVRVIVNYAARHGTQDELVIASEGSEGLFFLSENPKQKIGVEDFLNDLLSEQKRTNIKIANRIVFLGFEAFANLAPEQVQAYRDIAKSMGAEIVGPTNTVLNVFFSAGRYTKFMPDRRIVRDRLDMPYDPLVRLLEATDEKPQAIGDNRPNYFTWFDDAQKEAVEPAPAPKETQPYHPDFNGAFQAPLAAAPQTVYPRAAKITDRAVILRECPALSCPVIARMMKGTAVSVTGTESNGWLPVEIRDKAGYPLKGYAASRYLMSPQQ